MDKLFLGLILILSHATLFNIDIFPDFIGYAFIYLGTEEFLRKAYHLRQLRPLVLGLGIYDFIMFVTSFLQLSIHLGRISYFIHLIFSLLTIYVVYQIIEGIRDLEGYYRMDLRYLHLHNYFNAVMIMQIVSSILHYIPFTGLLITLIRLAVIIVEILFLVEFNRTRILFRNHFLN